MIAHLYKNPALLSEFIWQSVKDLPKESIDEVLSFLLFVRKKNNQPELFDIEQELIKDELRQKNNHEIHHLEMEFENYRNKFPHE